VDQSHSGRLLQRGRSEPWEQQHLVSEQSQPRISLRVLCVLCVSVQGPEQMVNLRVPWCVPAWELILQAKLMEGSLKLGWCWLQAAHAMRARPHRGQRSHLN
jgi:hypothetical protein